MIVVTAKSFLQWRDVARHLIMSDAWPDDVLWQESDGGQANLFLSSQSPASTVHTLNISKTTLRTMRRISCHRDTQKWALLYRVLWRINAGDTSIFEKLTDPLVHRLHHMEKEIARDAHKAKAFVRFRRVLTGGEEHFVAWHRPDHFVLPLIAPFFQRRFSVMKWSVLTPDESVSWDGKNLVWGLGFAQPPVLSDNAEDLWLRYYAATFNPARIKIKMMKRQMPVRHWATMPETVLIPKLLEKASARVGDMIANSEGSSVTAANFLPKVETFEMLKAASKNCKGCDLHLCASRTVFGEGALEGKIMMVGEQPGDQEDEHNRVFIGPAGVVLDEIFAEAGLDRKSLYLTNAVKHFKFVPKGKRRIHQTPNAREIIACKPWLTAEIRAIQPQVIVTLGLTPARSLIHQGFSLKHDGATFHSFGPTPIVPAWHPSAILRTPDVQSKQIIRAHMRKAFLHAVELSKSDRIAPVTDERRFL